MKAKFYVTFIFTFAIFIEIANAFTLTEIGKYSAIGYTYDVASSDKYLYIADTTGLYIYNITDLHLIARFSELRRLTSIAVYEDKAYVISEGQIFLLDITYPFEPRVIKQLPFYISAKQVSAYGNYVFTTNGGLSILNASNEFKIEAQFTYTDDSGTPEYLGVAASKDFTCVTSAKLNESGFREIYILNTASPNNPWLISKFSTVSTSAFPHYPQDVAIQGKYVYIVDKRLGILAVNISNEYAPRIIAQLNPFQEEPISIAIAGDKAFVTTGINLYILQINDGNPPEITISSPREGQVFLNETIVVQGFASDDSGIKSVMVNGMYAGNTSWSKEITLAPGWNNITIAALDYTGNIQTKTVAVRYTPQTPTPTFTPALTPTPEATPTLTPTKNAIGFEIILALIGALAIYVLGIINEFAKGKR
jgi:hypothetical protein